MMLVGNRPRKPQPVAEVGGEYPFISPGRLGPDDELPPSSRERKAWLKCHGEEPQHGEILSQSIIPGMGSSYWEFSTAPGACPSPATQRRVREAANPDLGPARTCLHRRQQGPLRAGRKFQPFPCTRSAAASF